MNIPMARYPKKIIIGSVPFGKPTVCFGKSTIFKKGTSTIDYRCAIFNSYLDITGHSIIPQWKDHSFGSIGPSKYWSGIAALRPPCLHEHPSLLPWSSLSNHMNGHIYSHSTSVETLTENHGIYKSPFSTGASDFVTIRNPVDNGMFTTYELVIRNS